MFIRFFNMDIIDMNLRCINKHHSTNSVSSSSTPPWALHPSSLPDPSMFDSISCRKAEDFGRKAEASKKREENVWWIHLIDHCWKKKCAIVFNCFICVHLIEFELLDFQRSILKDLDQSPSSPGCRIPPKIPPNIPPGFGRRGISFSCSSMLSISISPSISTTVTALPNLEQKKSSYAENYPTTGRAPYIGRMVYS